MEADQADIVRKDNPLLPKPKLFRNYFLQLFSAMNPEIWVGRKYGSPGKVYVLDYVVSDGLMPRAQRRSTDREHQLFAIR